jgi:acetyl esterase/lipase
MFERILRKGSRAGAAALMLIVTVGPAGAQTLLSARDLAGLPSPAPDFKIPYGPDALQFGKLRLPNGPGPLPVVVFIHGGCWLSAFDIQHAASLEQGLADEGYAVWSVEYRRVGDDGGGWPDSFLDVGEGVDYLRALAREYPLDLDRVVISGHSAGGAFALWVAARPRIPRESPLWTEEPLPVRAVVALAPAPNLAELHARGVCGDVIDGLMGGSPEAYPERYDAASPMRLTPLGLPQTLVVGALDRSWGPSGHAYYERATRSGDTDVRLVELPESGHFEMIVPTSSSWPRVLAVFRAAFKRMDH